MSLTWKDIKLATLQKMFAAEGSTIPTDESTKDYIAGMPYVANEALQRLSSAGKFITKPYTLAHLPVENLINEQTAKKLTEIKGKLSYAGEGALAYYFEFSGKGTVTISGDVAEMVSLDSKGTFTSYRGLIPNASASDVTIEFNSTYPSVVKNVALYGAEFDDADEVPAYAGYVRYNLKDLISDFYNMSDNQIYYEGGLNPEYLQTSDYYRESDNVLLLPRDKAGSYTIYYHAYPPQITIDTLDDYEFPLDSEVVCLMPLYMAAELYKDDDNGIATTYRNEFEVALESLIDSSISSGKEKFTSESGWI